MPWQCTNGASVLALKTLYPQHSGADPEALVSSHWWENSRRKEGPEPPCPTVLISIQCQELRCCILGLALPLWLNCLKQQTEGFASRSKMNSS